MEERKMRESFLSIHESTRVDCGKENPGLRFRAGQNLLNLSKREIKTPRVSACCAEDENES
jgi:hypothetical protein